jgi:hypothetical protein
LNDSDIGMTVQNIDTRRPAGHVAAVRARAAIHVSRAGAGATAAFGLSVGFALCLALAGCAGGPDRAVSATLGGAGAVRTLAPASLPLAANPAYAKFPLYVGTLGQRRIEMRLGAKTDEPGGVHGEYRFVDSRAVILVAGDRDRDTLEIEESDDGTRITGNWVGKFAADGSISGERLDDDDSNPQPFELRPASVAAGA